MTGQDGSYGGRLRNGYQMRILLLSFYFAPFNTMAAHRLSKLSRYLTDSGHDVRVVTADHNSIPQDIADDVAEDLIVRTQYFDIDILTRVISFVRRLSGHDRRARTESREPDSASVDCRVNLDPRRHGARVRRGVDAFYRNLLFWPDGRAGWLPYALPATMGLCRRWQPDLIYATAPPATSLLLGWIVSHRLSVPWVAEIRDRWADDPYDPRPGWRVFLDHKLENRVLSSTSGIITVSETWAQSYRERYAKPTAVIYNGFTSEDYSNSSGAKAADPETLRIVYTGAMYAGRDPMPLWKALGQLGNAAHGVRIEFYGAQRSAVLPGAVRYGVDRQVFVCEWVAHSVAVKLQCKADVLLMLQWNNPSEEGNLPGKLFEYLGAQRPILALGYPGGEMACIIRERSAGFVSNDPTAIARQLRGWCETKRREGRILRLPEAARTGFSREEQFGKLERFLFKLLPSELR